MLVTILLLIIIVLFFKNWLCTNLIGHKYRGQEDKTFDSSGTKFTSVRCIICGSWFIEIVLKNDHKYDELISAVGNKYTNETRHETALRYIKQAEISIENEQQTST